MAASPRERWPSKLGPAISTYNIIYIYIYIYIHIYVYIYI